jgi:uncharacterized protein DUF397
MSLGNGVCMMAMSGGGSDWSAQAGRIRWTRSSRCAGNGSCVEVARLSDGMVLVRDAKQPESPEMLVFNRDQWRGLLASITAGDFTVA